MWGIKLLHAERFMHYVYRDLPLPFSIANLSMRFCSEPCSKGISVVDISKLGVFNDNSPQQSNVSMQYTQRKHDTDIYLATRYLRYLVKPTSAEGWLGACKRVAIVKLRCVRG